MDNFQPPPENPLEALAALAAEGESTEEGTEEEVVVEAPIDERLLAGEPNNLLEMLKTDLRRDLQAAISSKNKIDTDVERYRGYFSLDKPAPSYEGAPNYVVPYIRAKVMGATAHFRGALDQDPFFVTRPYTEEAAKNQGPWEMTMEREIDRSGSRRHIFSAIQEACLTGTGVLQLSVTKPYDEFVVQAKAVRLEDFYVAPVGVDDIGQSSTFLRFMEPWHVVRNKFANGEYDISVEDAVRNANTTSKPNAHAQRDNTANVAYQSDNQPRELFECYYRWGTADLGYFLWRIIFHEQSGEILYARENPYADAFDAPPYVAVRPLPRIGHFYGESYAQVLEGIQNIMDFAYNSQLAHDQLAISPIVFVDRDSEIYDLIKDKGLSAGDIVPTRGDPKESVYVVPLPPAMEAMNLLQTARVLGEDATFSDLQLNGIPTNTVRSATEINAVTTAATKKLAEDLSNISHDLSVFARMYWSLIYAYKIEDKGVVPVFQGSSQYLIASHEITEEELTQRMVEFIQQRNGVQMQPEEAAMLGQSVRAQLEADGVELFISSAKRDDMEWMPNGSQLVPDKAMRANKLERLVTTLFPVIQLVRQDGAAWNLFRDYLKSLDVVNWREIMPQRPPEGEANPEQMGQFTQSMNQLRQGGGQ